MSKQANKEPKDFYRVILQCFDAPGAAPYADALNNLYASEREATDALRLASACELETLDEASNEFGEYAYCEGGKNCATVSFCEVNPVSGARTNHNITLYDIVKGSAFEGGYKYRGFYVLEDKEGYAVEQFDVVLGKHKTLDEALFFIDDMVLAFAIEADKKNLGLYKDCPYSSFFDYFCSLREGRAQQGKSAPLDQQISQAAADKSKGQMYEFSLPVTWEVCGYVTVQAASLEEAIAYFRENADHIPLPQETQYVDGSFDLSADEFEAVEAMSSCKPIPATGGLPPRKGGPGR